MRQIIESIDEGVLTLNADGRIGRASERAASMLGRRREDLIGRSLEDLGIHIGKEGSSEARVVRENGSEAWLSLTIAPLLDGERREGALVLMRDISERRRTEKALAAAEARYRALFQNPREVVALLRYVLDDEDNIIDTVFVEVNSLFLKIVGLPREEVIGKKVTEVLGADAFQESLPMLRAMRSDDRPVSFETYFGKLDAYVRNLFSPVDEETFILNSMDITRAAQARRQAEENAEIARRHSEELDVLMDAVPSAVWIAHDAECRVITGNRAANIMFEVGADENVSAGTSKGEVLDRSRRFFRNGVELRPEELPLQVAAAKGAEVRNFEVEALLPSGKRIIILGHAIPLFDGEGKVRGSMATSIDITARKKREQELDFQARSLASVHDAIVAMDGDGTITYWNKMAEELFGWTAEEAIGWNAMDFIWSDHPDPKRQASVRKLMGTGFFEGESVFLRKDGREIITSTHARALRDSDGAVVEMVFSFRDITESKMAERELEEYSRKLERFNSELQQFAHIASHDLQEPLRMVTLYLDLLERKYGNELSPQAREYMDIARQGARRMRQLIDDLLLYSRIDTDLRDFTEVDMGEVFRSTAKELVRVMGEKEARIEIDPMPVILANEVQMRQLATNLFSNALKFHRAGVPPVIEVSASTIGDVCVFSVKDNGIGVEARHKDKLFKVFSRLHTRDEYPGTGIGLAICKKIVERHGGWIWMESDGKSGSTFHFTIPYSRRMDAQRSK
jgi:PAS domain S-box-containing protein